MIDEDLWFPIIECSIDNVAERQEIAEKAIGETLSILNKQIQWVHDNYAIFAQVEYHGGDSSKRDKWIEVTLITAICRGDIRDKNPYMANSAS